MDCLIYGVLRDSTLDFLKLGAERQNRGVGKGGFLRPCNKRSLKRVFKEGEER